MFWDIFRIFRIFSDDFKIKKNYLSTNVTSECDKVVMYFKGVKDRLSNFVVVVEKSHGKVEIIQ